MGMRTAKGIVLTLLLAVGLALPAAAQTSAQPWPPKTVHIVAPFGPGSTPDIVARLIADRKSVV